jgi:SAM-dependent methyltransferase
VRVVADRESHEADLAAYYDQEAATRASRTIDPRRVEWRAGFADLMAAEGRRTLLEVGVGPGHDARALRDTGVTVTGVDLSAEHVRLSTAEGIEAYVASALDLPFADDSFAAGWTMSTLLHVPDVDIDDALAEITRVLQPGAPLAIGVWGGRDWEGRRVEDDIVPPRFFSLRTDKRLGEIVGRHGRLERFDTWAGHGTSWTYQALVLRLP